MIKSAGGNCRRQNNVPQRCLCTNSRSLWICYFTWQREIEVIISWNLNYLGGPHVITSISKSKSRKKNSENRRRGTKPRNATVSRRLKRQENSFSCYFQKEMELCWYLDYIPMRLMPYFWAIKLQGNKFVFFKKSLSLR